MKSMLQSLMLLGALLVLSSCASVQVPNIKAWVELPASKRGFAVETVTKREHYISAQEWEEKRKSAVHIFSEDWKVLKSTIRSNCIQNKCKEAVGALDGLFLAIDNALKKVY